MDTKSNTMSIEEYRNMYLSTEDEWNFSFNSKRTSIEAINEIMIRKRGKGELKKVYTSKQNLEEGPYYDPQCFHIHIWKKKELIKNFQGEQRKNVEYIEHLEEKSGFFCCICHERNKTTQFKWNERLDSIDDVPNDPSNFNEISHLLLKPPQNKVHIKENKNWERLLFKVKHVISSPKIEYKISNTKILYLWPWELTPYQQFKIKNPNYKKNKIFLPCELDRFQDNYGIIT